MQVSYSKPTVTTGRRWEAQRLTIGRCHVVLHGRKRRISAAGKILYFMTRV